MAKAKKKKSVRKTPTSKTTKVQQQEMFTPLGVFVIGVLTIALLVAVLLAKGII